MLLGKPQITKRAGADNKRADALPSEPAQLVAGATGSGTVGSAGAASGLIVQPV
jgi:hypothetical protein